MPVFHVRDDRSCTCIVSVLSWSALAWGFLLLFPALDTNIAPRERLKEEERNSTDHLALALTKCTHSVSVALLTLWNLRQRTLIVK